MVKTKELIQEAGREKTGWDWDTGSCPFIFFGDDKAAENDLMKLKALFGAHK